LVVDSLRAGEWERFGAELLSLYGPSMRARATRGELARVLRDLAAVGVESPAGLTVAAVAALVARYHAAGLAANSIRGHLAYCRVVCNYARHAGYLARSPFELRREWVRREPVSAARSLCLSRDDVARLLADLAARADVWPSRRLHALVAVVAFTGLRKMEALRLRVEDLDRSRGVLHVVARRRLKTFASAAPVPIPPGLDLVLDGWLPLCGGEWVIPGARGRGPWLSGGLGSRPLDALQLAAARVGIPRITFQSLRHTWATQAESAWGLSDLQIQRVLRHTSPLTQRHYRHADLANLRAIGSVVSFTS
jgi:integrase